MPLKPTKLEKLFTEYTNADGYTLYSLLDTIHVGDNINESLFTDHHISSQDSWTSISYKYFDTIDMWWVVAICNRHVDGNPVEMPPVGTKIRIPSVELVYVITNTASNN